MCAQGPIGVGCLGLEQCRKGLAEAGRGGVDRRQGGNEPKSSLPPLVRKEYCEWWKARFWGENRHRSKLETVGDPSLHLPPMDLHLAVKAFGGCEQVSTI